MTLGLFFVALSYAAGTFPTALLVARAAGHDPTREGSGNPGASNVYRLAGAKAGLVVFLGDLAKGALAAGAGLAFGGRALGMACGIAAVAGHMFPATRRFRGGRGVATAGGLIAALYPLITVVLVAAWFAIARLTRKASLASLGIALATPVLVLVTGRPGWEVATITAVGVLVVARHASNVRRLLRGEERSLHRGAP